MSSPYPDVCNVFSTKKDLIHNTQKQKLRDISKGRHHITVLKKRLKTHLNYVLFRLGTKYKQDHSVQTF